MQSEAASAFDVTVELACFGAGDQIFGVDIQQIREVVRPLPITPMPKAPPLIEGVMDLRGVVVPVVDLGKALGGDPVPDSATSRIAILDVDEMVFGLRIERAIEVIQAEIGNVDEPPQLATQSGYDAVRAVVRQRDAAPVMVLSLEHVLESVYRSARNDSFEGIR